MNNPPKSFRPLPRHPFLMTALTASILFAGSIGAKEPVRDQSAEHKISPAVLEAIQSGRPDVAVTLTVKAHAIDPPFYRPLWDDPVTKPDSSPGTPGDRPSKAVDTSTDNGGGIPLAPGQHRLTLPTAVINKIAQNPQLVSITTDDHPYRQTGMHLIDAGGFQAVHSAGVLGSGRIVAILDASFDASQLGGAVIQEECFYMNAPAGARCPNGSTRQSGKGAADANPPGSLGRMHGTRVAGVIRNADGGAAPQARIIVGAVGSTTDAIAAMQWFATHRPDIDVFVLPMRQGSYAGVCDMQPGPSAWLPAIKAVSANGAMVIAGAGNDNSDTMIGSPACISDVIGVSASWSCSYDPDLPGFCADPDAVKDRLWRTSNKFVGTEINETIRIIAPGGPHTILGPADTGTSFAAPLVGACALLAKQLEPSMTASQFLTRIQNSDLHIPLPANASIQVPRLNCGMALAMAPTQLPMNQFGLSGSWYNPMTPGQGLKLMVFPNNQSTGIGTIFAGWFTYSGQETGASQQRWYTIQGNVYDQPGPANLTIYANQGGNFASAPDTVAQPVGTATLSFDSCTSGRLEYSLNGVTSGVIPLTRLTADVACTATGALGPVNQDFNRTGLYHDPSISGQGLVIEVNPLQPAGGSGANGLIMGGWFTYAQNGAAIGGLASQRWFTLQGGFQPGSPSGSFVGIYETTGGRLDSSAPVSTRQVGTATIDFDGCWGVSVSYRFNPDVNDGSSGVLNLSRIGAPPPFCQ